jgi:hypothetical protein
MQYRFLIPRIDRLLRGSQVRVLLALSTGLLVACLASCTGVVDREANATPIVFGLAHSPNGDYEGVILARRYSGFGGPLLYTGRDRAQALESGPDSSVMKDCVILLPGSVKNLGKLRKGDVVRVWSTGFVMFSSPPQVRAVRIEKVD